ncbi:MAG: ribosome silencing factor [Bacteroidetes bacterium]|nr:ribosome silencing factor [Bacteroidota bacterium]
MPVKKTKKTTKPVVVKGRKKIEKKVEKKPKSTTKKAEPKILDIIIDAIKEKKGDYIVSLDLTSIKNSVTNYFVICQANSTTQTAAIAESVEDEVKKKLQIRPYHVEGRQNSEWILIDYADIVVHIFQPDIRSFYNLEALWADAKIKKHN